MCLIIRPLYFCLDQFRRFQEINNSYVSELIRGLILINRSVSHTSLVVLYKN